MLEDPTYIFVDFIHNLIHEINHAISFQFIDLINKLYIREGADESLFKIKNGYKVNEECEFNNDALITVEETWNELQAEKITEIFFTLFPDFSIPNYEDSDRTMNCNYTNYYFLLKDVYDLYEEEIKKSKIDINYNFYKRHGLESSNFKTYIEYYKSQIINKFNKNTGVVDYYKILDLAYLTEYFKVEILSKFDRMFTQDLLSDEEFLNSLSQETRDRLFEIVEKKNKVVASIIRESPPKMIEKES